jgi:hypothetical protein
MCQLFKEAPDIAFFVQSEIVNFVSPPLKNPDSSPTLGKFNVKYAL